MNRRSETVLFLCRLLVGGCFLYAGAAKAFDPRAFAGEIAAYRLFPHLFNLLIAATLPWIEIVTGALVLGGRKLLPAAWVLVVLEALFAVILLSAIVRGLNIDCGCLGAGGGRSLPEALLGDLVLLGLTVTLCRLQPLPRDDD